MRKHDVVGIGVCLTAIAAFVAGGDGGSGWYIFEGIIFLISLINTALYKRPTDPTSLSWDIGMGDDFRQTGKHVPIEGNDLPNPSRMHRVAFQN